MLPPPPTAAHSVHPADACRERLRVVLVGTQHPGNIGSSARAMHTMGLAQLWLVAPRRFPDPEAEALAAGARGVLDGARVVATLDEALAQCRVAYGCSARGRHVALPELGPREAAERLVTAATASDVALVFGPERTGLDNRDLQRCQAAVRIPANPEYPSLNLAAAVQVLAYELRMAMLAAHAAPVAPTATPILPAHTPAPAADAGVTQAEMEALLAEGKPLQEKDSLALLKGMGMSILPSFMLESEKDLAAKKADLRFPAALKTAVPGILHKADVGGVVLNIPDYDTLAERYREMAGRLGPEAVVSPMLCHNTELIFGMKLDPTFGPLVIVGAGGIYTEMLRDRVILLPSAGEAEIAEKLKSLKTYKLLCGFRGSKPANMEKLVKEVRRFCCIAQSLAGKVKEIDINPMAIEGDEIVALDALVIPS